MAKNKVYDEDFKKMIVELYESKTTTAANIVREYGIGSVTFIESWCNRKRIYSSIDYKTPYDIEKNQHKITRFCVQKLDIDSV